MMEDDAGIVENMEAEAPIADEATADADLERLRGELSAERYRAEASITEAARLQAELIAATDAATAFDADLTAMREMLESAEQRIREGATRYRDLAIRGEPSLPPDLIAGDTIEAVDASLASARELTTRIRSRIESQAQAARIPAGAPHRAAPDLSAMSPEQKIRYGLEQRSRA